MTEFLPKILSKVNFKELGDNLKNYTDLYLKPISAWKKAFNQEKSGYNFTVLHIIYYTLLVLLIVQDIYLSIQLVILEIIITLIPLLFFLTPYKIGVKFFGVKERLIKVFRTFLIIKFQFIPSLCLMILLAKWSSSEILFIIFDNFIWGLCIGFIIAVPIICSLKLWQRLTWILLNYIFFLIGILIIGFVLSEFGDNDVLSKKLSNVTPNREYESIKRQSKTKFLFTDNEIVTILNVKDSLFHILAINPSSHYIKLAILQNSRNELIENWKKNDSIIANSNQSHTSESAKYKIDKDAIKLDLDILLKYYRYFNKKYDEDMQLYNVAKDSCIYTNNKEYFKYCYEYYSFYKSIFTNLNLTKKIIVNQKAKDLVHINGSNVVVLYELDSTLTYPNKLELNELEKKLEKRANQSDIIMRILFYPIILITERLM